MKMNIMMICLLVFAASFTSEAQQTKPTNTKDQIVLKKRVRAQIDNGTVTRSQAKKLHLMDRKVKAKRARKTTTQMTKQQTVSRKLKAKNASRIKAKRSNGAQKCRVKNK